ncbi:TonB-dependent receptor [Rheinheimera sp. UJ51]|uniref:TonB-dependent receptor n=1 Tax=unclassified Rheinheimera TaxID=115860 RepID=UPI001E3D1770|nr:MULTISPECIES: TonB-dependent receptor [unclassified Rheinheimera]MCC5453384.1 TonB-dependent receptor [Rheinheimera sp. UJ51]MCF4010962.1 TonB-dependent receptor [Rheinheimera sp. UJ63]
MKTRNNRFKTGSAALLLAISTPSLIAQEVSKALNSEQESIEVEVIEVKGVRSALEAALNIKKESASVVDAISATDIDELPALDLGEALQALPGIQLNRDSESRDSEISLRGLPGDFVKTTAIGQSITTPSRSEGAAGESNPFGAFEAGIFDGVTVIKSPTADLQAGGIAGIVDLQFQRALSKRDGLLKVDLGTRYEDLSEDFNTNYRLQGVKHFMDGRLGIAFKVAGSGQNYRRDTVNFTQYTDLVTFNQETGLQTGVRPVISAEAIDAYRAQHGLEDNSQIRVISRAGQAAEVQNGDRHSGALNFEFKVTDDLKLGLDYIYTKRTLDQSNLEDTQFLLRSQADNAQQQITLLGAPSRSGFAGPGDPPSYTVGHARITNVNWLPANRLLQFTEDAKGLYLYGDYIKDDWVVDGTFSKSESENFFINEGIDLRHQVDGSRGSFNPTGIDIEINTGNGDLSQAFINVLNPSALNSYIYDGNWSSPSVTGFNSGLPRSVNGNRRVDFYVNGRVDNPIREMDSGELNVLRYTNFGFRDVFRLDSLKSGYRYQKEQLINNDLRIGAGGINVGALTTANIFGNAKLFVETQGGFFNGEFPGAFGPETGWVTIDSTNLRPLLQSGILDRLPAGSQLASPTGWAVHQTQGRNTFFARNFDTTQDISAAYLMGNFSGQLGSVLYSGNLGFRRIETDNVFTGAFIDSDGVLQQRTLGNSYSHTLPSLNIKLELTEDVILRLASYEGIVRPNLRSQNPTTIITANEDDDGDVTSVRVDLPSSDVKPYTAENFDISLEWYNREGSAISIGFFEKEITGLFGTAPICGDDIPSYVSDGLFGPTGLVEGSGTGGIECRELEPFTDSQGNVSDSARRITVNQAINTNGSIKVTGYELAIQQKLDFLSYPWNGFGGVFNYTKINTDESADGTTLLRVSPESYNIIGYWENDGFSIRLTYNWRDAQQLSQNIILDGTNSGFLGTDARFETARGRLDMAASYTFNRNFRVDLRAFNLTADQGYEYIGGNKDAVNRIRYDGRTYSFGVSYTF